MSAGARKLAELHLDALYRTDAGGRILAVRDPDVPAPRFHLLRTAEANHWRFRADLPDTLVARLDALCRDEPVVDDFREPPRQLAAIRKGLGTPQPAHQYRGPAFVLDGPWTPPRGGVVAIDRGSVSVLRPHFEWAKAAFDAAWPLVVRLDEGVAVSLCHSARLTPRAAEAGVETVERHRHRGHASAVVGEWARIVSESGRVALYSTTWENLASRAVARALGGRLYGEDAHIG